MGKIAFDLLPKQKPRKHNTMVEVDLYPYATELYEELASIGIIDRTMSIPQLGVIRVSKKLAKTRYDYIMLQLYLHQLIKMHLQMDLHTLQFTLYQSFSSITVHSVHHAMPPFAG